MTEYSANFHVDLGVLMGTLQSSIQLAINRVSFGLQAGRQSNVSKLELPDAQPVMKLAGRNDPDAEEVRRDHESWTLANGLRDCAEALNAFLDRCQRVCVLYSFGTNAKVPAEDWNRLAVEGSERFQFLGLGKKLDWLRTEYGLEIDADTGSDLLTINSARNCLVHRHGFVRQSDANSDGGLEVQWTKPELKVEGLDGVVRSVVIPEKLAAGEKILFAQDKTSKTFAIGDRIQFDAQEFSELCWTYHISGLHIVKAVEEFGRAKGFKFREPNPLTTEH